ncbi:MAG TPA: nucleotidyltransferase family protein [Candidatus Ventricola intestinavium]|nr:nucleotidyltransferase family protein [Candidatus Ventricola intestinavium]
MRVCAVICEYNPFHNGHAHHLAQARAQSGADYVLCLMSGALTQRGTFARHDKWTRARMAMQGGADLVLELPARFACAPAEEFASGALALLSALGVVTHLSFGCEREALPDLSLAARLLGEESPALSAALRERLARGLSFPQARALALEETGGIPGLAAKIAHPNAALAIEYMRALPPQIQPVPIERVGSGYHDGTPGTLASATAVRGALARGDLAAAREAMPVFFPVEQAEKSGFIHEEEALTQTLFYLLRTMDAGRLAAVPGMDEGLENRFLRAAQTCATREELLAAVKSRRYTHARLSRLCAYVLLGLTRDWVRQNRVPTYARVLGFRRGSTGLLSAIKANSRLPLITKAARFREREPLFSLDARAQDLWSLGVRAPHRRAAGLDFTTSPAITGSS